MSYTAIVPIYNENPRVLDVVEALQKCAGISEIICVDDGSTDGSGETVRKNYGNVTVIRHEINLGKLQAVRTGVGACSNENVILMDSDLKALIPAEIDKAFEVFEKNKLDCLLLCTKPMSASDRIVRFFRLAHIATGCRIIKKEILEQSIVGSGKFGYHLEPAQNKYLMENHKKVAYVNISAVGILKARKVGLLKGLQQDFRMWYEVLSYGGVIFNINQTLFFARRKVS